MIEPPLYRPMSRAADALLDHSAPSRVKATHQAMQRAISRQADALLD